MRHFENSKMLLLEFELMTKKLFTSVNIPIMGKMVHFLRHPSFPQTTYHGETLFQIEVLYIICSSGHQCLLRGEPWNWRIGQIEYTSFMFLLSTLSSHQSESHKKPSTYPSWLHAFCYNLGSYISLLTIITM